MSIEYKIIEPSPGRFLVSKKEPHCSTMYLSIQDNGKYWWSINSQYFTDCITTDKNKALMYYNSLLNKNYTTDEAFIASMSESIPNNYKDLVKASAKEFFSPLKKLLKIKVKIK